MDQNQNKLKKHPTNPKMVDVYCVVKYCPNKRIGVGAYIEPFRLTKEWTIQYVECVDVDEDYVWDKTIRAVTHQIRNKGLVPHFVAYQIPRDDKDRQARRNNKMFSYLSKECTKRFSGLIPN